MKLTIPYLYLTLLLFVSTAICSTSSEDLGACKKACGDFLPKLRDFVQNPTRTQADFGLLSPFWTTCQYKCYRCHLPMAVNSMENIRQAVYSTELKEVQSTLTDNERAINIGIQRSCYDRWEKAIQNNDDSSTFYY